MYPNHIKIKQVNKATRIFIILIIISIITASTPAMVNAAPFLKIACAFDYHIRKNDTLGKIASRHGVKSVDIVRVNSLKKPYAIYIGQTICIPNKSKEGFKDIPVVYANARAAYFVIGWERKGIKIRTIDFPKNESYFVKVNDPNVGISRSEKLGTLRTGKKGVNSFNYPLPKELRDATVIHVCLKNTSTDLLLCNVLYKWGDQSYPPSQRVR